MALSFIPRYYARNGGEFNAKQIKDTNFQLERVKLVAYLRSLSDLSTYLLSSRTPFISDIEAFRKVWHLLSSRTPFVSDIEAFRKVLVTFIIGTRGNRKTFISNFLIKIVTLNTFPIILLMTKHKPLHNFRGFKLRKKRNLWNNLHMKIMWYLLSISN